LPTAFAVAGVALALAACGSSKPSYCSKRERERVIVG
jgi:hypothetical protein